MISHAYDRLQSRGDAISARHTRHNAAEEDRRDMSYEVDEEAVAAALAKIKTS